jgi:threonine dehydrogenase-like Zn-dependent dehydrogenase
MFSSAGHVSIHALQARIVRLPAFLDAYSSHFLLQNHFNIGAFMEKQLTMRGGQTPVQKYWHDLKTLIEKGVLDPTMVLTHTLPIEDGPEGYKIFNDKTDGCVKVVLKPHAMAAGA